jgi:hypothetical protein
LGNHVSPTRVVQAVSLVALTENAARLVWECRAIILGLVGLGRPAATLERTPLELVVHLALESRVRVVPHGVPLGKNAAAIVDDAV